MKIETANIELGQNGHLQVCGVLSFATVPKLRDLGNQMMIKSAELVFDFKKVTHSDSSGLALLTAWTRYASQLKKTLRFINIPVQLVDVARLSNLDDVLSLSES